ncbi:hypothetical protein HMPREF3197_00686 [Klebsiella pneumoniae]|nr:hypothetical protein HMPREF3197_00686 [Klebsiella pneumoniae]
MLSRAQAPLSLCKYHSGLTSALRQQYLFIIIKKRIIQSYYS